MFHTKFVEEIKPHIFYSVTSVFEKRTFFLDNVEKHGRLGQAADENMAHAHCMLDD